MQFALGLEEEPEFVFDFETGLEFRSLLFGEVLHFLQTDQKIKVAKSLLKWEKVSTNVSLTDLLPHVAHFFDIILRRT